MVTTNAASGVLRRQTKGTASTTGNTTRSHSGPTTGVPTELGCSQARRRRREEPDQRHGDVEAPRVRTAADHRIPGDYLRGGARHRLAAGSGSILPAIATGPLDRSEPLDSVPTFGTDIEPWEKP